MSRGQTKPVEMPIANIVLDPHTISRWRLRYSVIQSYASRMQAGDTFPPVTLFGTMERAWIGDGWHRVLAARETKDTILANVRPGSRDAAINHALSANATNGVRRSVWEELDFLYFILSMVSDDVPDKVIADGCVTDHFLVAAVRADLRAKATEVQAFKDIASAIRHRAESYSERKMSGTLSPQQKTERKTLLVKANALIERRDEDFPHITCDYCGAQTRPQHTEHEDLASDTPGRVQGGRFIKASCEKCRYHQQTRDTVFATWKDLLEIVEDHIDSCDLGSKEKGVKLDGQWKTGNPKRVCVPLDKIYTHDKTYYAVAGTVPKMIGQSPPACRPTRLIHRRLRHPRRDVVLRYAERIQHGDRFPPVVLIPDTSDVLSKAGFFHIADGWHRIMASIEIGKKEIDAWVLEDASWLHAVFYAAGVNALNGTERTEMDTSRTIELAIRLHPAMADDQIARRCRVTYEEVENISRGDKAAKWRRERFEKPADRDKTEMFLAVQKAINRAPQASDKAISKQCRTGQKRDATAKKVADIRRHLQELSCEAPFCRPAFLCPECGSSQFTVFRVKRLQPQQISQTRECAVCGSRHPVKTVISLNEDEQRCLQKSKSFGPAHGLRV